MAGGRPPSEKTFTNMLRLALKEAHEDGGDKLRAVADVLVSKAVSGDIQAIKEIADRLEGRPVQAVEGTMEHTADELSLLLGRIAGFSIPLVNLDDDRLN